VRLSRNISSTEIGDVIDDHPDAANSEFTVATNHIIGDWRWGTEWQLVVQDGDGRYWETIYREQIQPEYYNSLFEAQMITFDEVEPYEEVVVKFRGKK